MKNILDTRLENLGGDKLGEVLDQALNAIENAELLAQENDEDYISYRHKNPEDTIGVGAALVLARPIAQKKQQMTLDYIYKAKELINSLKEGLEDIKKEV